MTASTIPPLSVWPFGPPGRVSKHKGAQTAIGPSQSPSRSLETARPVGRASALDLCPGAKVSGSKTDLLTPWYDGKAEIIPSRYLPVLLGGKGTSHVVEREKERGACIGHFIRNGKQTRGLARYYLSVVVVDDVSLLSSLNSSHTRNQ